MKRGVLALAVLALVGVAMLGKSMLLAPRLAARAEAREQVEAARQEEAVLQANLAQLRTLAADPATGAEAARLGKLIPPDADLAGFIRTMDGVAAASKVDWSSLVPAPPVPGAAGGPATIGLTISVNGTFFQILDYLKRLETLERLVVIDAVDLAAGGTGGTPTLAVNVRARTFAASAGPGTTGATAQPAPPAGDIAAPAPTGGR